MPLTAGEMPVTDNDLAAAKARLRGEARTRRTALSPAARAAMSERIATRAIGLMESRRSSVVAAYVAMRSEVDLSALVAWAHERGCDVALPAVVGAGRMVFRLHPPGGRLVDAGFGTVAPPDDAPVVTPDTVFAPLIAFDRTGGRLGWGGGFYDGAVARLRTGGGAPLVAGAAFGVQETVAIPREPHDRPLDLVITEDETIACGRS